MVLTVTSGKTILVVEWAFGLDLIISVLFCLVTAFELFFPHSRKYVSMHFLVLFSVSSNPPDEKDDMYKGQISDVLHNPPPIPPLYVLGKIKSRG